ncbi:MAG: Hsp20/alpha crystallin family protein [Phycisphaerae bacterium]|nr:Hsp20/alpha crystallin family protein [Phycisphaerae bacterium]
MSCCNSQNECQTSSKSVAHFRPPVDVFESDAGFRIVADVPGSAADSIDLDFEKNTLTLTARVSPRSPENARPLIAEYQVGDYRRTFRFDESVDADKTTAEFNAGVLTIQVPKSEAARKRKIQVNSA